ncbi:hypothetical protein J537_0074 [Acinetobacter baumannii 1437282]|nr:hypothetical protein J537_0074 [Acinetobacter baumannii 1437282]
MSLKASNQGCQDKGKSIYMNYKYLLQRSARIEPDPVLSAIAQYTECRYQ